MKSKRKNIPELFDNAEEAGEFWDTHSVSDYWDETEETEAEFDLQERMYEVPLAEKIYQFVKSQAEAEHLTVREVVHAILERALAVGHHGRAAY